jgi:hypothetical protein
MRKKTGDLAAALGRSKGKKGVLAVGGAICLVAWATFLISMAVGVGTAAQIVLLSVALVATEALFWVAAALLGITVVQLRRKLLGKFLPGRRGDAA